MVAVTADPMAVPTAAKTTSEAIKAVVMVAVTADPMVVPTAAKTTNAETRDALGKLTEDGRGRVLSC